LHLKVASSEVFTESGDLGETVTAPSEWCGMVFGVLSVGVCAQGHKPLHGSGFAPVGGLVQQRARPVRIAGVGVGIDRHTASDELVEDVQSFANRRGSSGSSA
jgi:hypothetical protein